MARCRALVANAFLASSRDAFTLSPANTAALRIQGVAKAAQEAFQEAPPGDGSLEELAREARCAAFAFIAALFVATQSKEKVFNGPLKHGSWRGIAQLNRWMLVFVISNMWMEEQHHMLCICIKDIAQTCEYHESVCTPGITHPDEFITLPQSCGGI